MIAEKPTFQDVTELLSEHNAKDLLRFITCGNVDDGKSTLIGRLLLEAGAIYEDQIEALHQESVKHGNNGDALDTALLLDGLEDERQQGITIDVAYRYFSTSTRKFIIADTPGHEQFTRNMATGASMADLAVILVDASKGISTQTKRHAFIVSLLGIQHVVLAVNKMDLVNYEQATFDQICDDFDRFRKGLPRFDVCAIPLSALAGENVVTSSDSTSWYKGPSLLDQLNRVRIVANTDTSQLRFPVQWVNRPDADFRGFSGTIAAGSMAVGDEVMVLPSEKLTRIASIITLDGSLDQAGTSDSITVTLEDEIDVTRGDMLVRPAATPCVSRQVEATLVWMSEKALVPGKQYWLKHTTRRTSCEIATIHFAINVNTIEQVPAASLDLNEIGRCTIKLHESILYDAYMAIRETGSFILVDRISHETVAAGMLIDSNSDPETPGLWDAKSNTIAPRRARSLVSEDARILKYQHEPFTVLITGLSGAGKSSVAMELEKQLFEAGRHCLVLDGQTLRLGINRDLGFSAEERSENLRRAAELAKLVNDAGQICIAAFVAPSQWVRRKARELIGPKRFLHVHLTTSAEVCRQRDTTGQYRAADEGQITSFPGVTFDYEEPTDAEAAFDTQDRSTEAIVGDIFSLIKKRSWLVQ